MPHTRIIRGKTQVYIDIAPHLEQIVADLTGKRRRTALTRFVASKREQAETIGEFLAIIDRAKARARAAHMADHTWTEYDYRPDALLCPIKWHDGEPPPDYVPILHNGMVLGYHDPRWPMPRPIMALPSEKTVPGSSLPSDKIPFITLVNKWADEAGKTTTTRKARHRPMKRLAIHIGHDNAAAVTNAELNSYLDSRIALQVAGNLSVASVRSDVIDLNAMFGYLAEKFGVPDVANLRYRGEKEHDTEAALLTPSDQAVILRAARQSSEPFIRWGSWLGCFTGARLAELAEIDTRDFETVEGIPAIHIRTLHRQGEARLKTIVSKRSLPLHPALVTEGLLDFIADVVSSRGHGPLFRELPIYDGRRNKSASNKMGSFMRGLGFSVESRKRFHSWRATVRTVIEGDVSPDRARFILGHASGKDIDAGVYLRHPLPNLVSAISLIPHPLDAQVLNAAAE
jgi:integrase